MLRIDVNSLEECPRDKKFRTPWPALSHWCYCQWCGPIRATVTSQKELRAGLCSTVIAFCLYLYFKYNYPWYTIKLLWINIHEIYWVFEWILCKQYSWCHFNSVFFNLSWQHIKRMMLSLMSWVHWTGIDITHLRA